MILKEDDRNTILFNDCFSESVIKEVSNDEVRFLVRVSQFPLY